MIDQIGSPPRVRGTATAQSASERSTGITPACAGNSLKAYQQWQHPGDHPRVCGEQFGSAIQRAARLGSPPRVRGTGCLGG